MADSGRETLKRQGATIALCSRGIGKITRLATLLQTRDAKFVQAGPATRADVYVGWGNKPSGKRAMELAKKAGRPFVLLEDAFIRSHAPQSVSGEQSLGLCLDDLGIYYDASRSSRLEQLVKGACSDQHAIARGKQLMAHLARSKICKYNNFDPVQSVDIEAGFVLVVDQTWQDHSVSGAGADEQTFASMLDAAIAENPGSRIVVKLHPEVLADKKKGYLKDLATKAGCTLLADNINPWDLFKHTSCVYTVSSQLGFDALLAGRKVRCFGMPFYAGWGLTHDETTCDRRTGFKPDLAAIADAAFNQYASYVSAYDDEPNDAATAINQLTDIRNAHQENARLAAFYQVTPWKWTRIKSMFCPLAKDQTFFWTRKGAIAAAKKRHGDLVAWASRIDETLTIACKNAGVNLQRLEDGFIRSVGLGTNFHLPMSLIIDDLGIYYDPRQPSRLEYILQNATFQPDDLERAQNLIDTIVTNAISKYNVGETETLDGSIPADKNIILVPGQVDDDASIRFGGNGMTGAQLLSQVRSSNPDAFIIFKPHPDVLSGQRPGLRDKQTIEKYADINTGSSDISIGALIEICHAVHTISSLTGFEALLRGKQVHCYGLPFYAGWGLTIDSTVCPRRTRKLSLQMLAFATLIEYPRYHDPVANLPCGPEQVIRRIRQQREHPTDPNLLIRIRTTFGKWRSRLT